MPDLIVDYEKDLDTGEVFVVQKQVPSCGILTQLTTTKLLYRAADRPAVSGVVALTGFCYICGARITEGVPVDIALKGSFNNRDIAARPDGVGFCAPCAFSFEEKSPILTARTGRPTLQRMRTYTHLISESWEPVTKASKVRIKEFLLSPPSGWWATCIAESGQKHLLFRCPVNFGAGPFRLLLEEELISATSAEIQRAVSVVEALLQMGASNTMIESGLYSQSFLRQVDLIMWERVEQQVSQGRGSGLFRLALFLSKLPEHQNAE